MRTNWASKTSRLPCQVCFIWSNTSRAVSKMMRWVRNSRASRSKLDAADLAHVRFAFQHRGQFGHLRRLCGVQFQRAHLCPIQRPGRAERRARCAPHWASGFQTSALAGSGSTAVLGAGGGGGPSSPPSCGRKVKGTPKMLTYSGSNSPVSGLTS